VTSLPEAGGRELEAAQVVARRLLENIESVVLGKTEQVRLVLAALASGGHVLFDDVPGTAKTVLARSIGGSIDGASQARIQCTPDLQPTDTTGLSVFDPQHRRFEFQPGPVFANVVLVDEINRATPKTQSALLEAMAEQQVTVDGVTRQLPDPFLLIATENPIEYEGTFPLPEAQLDRFAVRATLGYPGEDDEIAVLRQQRHGHPLERLEPVISVDDVVQLRQAAEAVYVDDLLEQWIVQLVRATRGLEEIAVGASVRGSLALLKTARGWALMHDREFVRPEDVLELFVPVLGHRLVLSTTFAAETRHLSTLDVLELVRNRCVELAPPPRPDWPAGSGAA
jgi:MoxR-like ATPase